MTALPPMDKVSPNNVHNVVDTYVIVERATRVVCTRDSADGKWRIEAEKGCDRGTSAAAGGPDRRLRYGG